MKMKQESIHECPLCWETLWLRLAAGHHTGEWMNRGGGQYYPPPVITDHSEISKFSKVAFRADCKVPQECCSRKFVSKGGDWGLDLQSSQFAFS